MSELLDNSAKSAAPEVTVKDVERLIEVLRKAETRQTANELCIAMFGQATEGLKRKVRKMASAARPRVVSFPGSNGYQLWERCTIDEIQHGIASLEAQGKDMIRDANVYRTAYYRMSRMPLVKTPDGQLQLL